MTMRSVLFLILFLCPGGVSYAQQGFVHQRSSDYVWPEDSLVLEKLDRWQDLKFGVLLHWGLYSVPGIVESWSICSEDENWIPRDSTVEYEAYKKWYWGLIDRFNPQQFNPGQWAEVAGRAGMKYMVFTTKHHDGFNLFDTKQTDFSIAHGAFRNHPRKDVARYVFEAFRERNFMIGAYFSKPDWHSEYYWWPRYATPTRNVNYKIDRHPERWAAFQDFIFRQLSELMQNYGQVDILWLDGGWVAAPRQDIKIERIAGMARKAQPGLLMVDRTIHGKYENYQTPERTIPEGQLSYPWESCIPLSKDWGWILDATFKSARTVLTLLTEVVAKGGNLLLGIGPTPEGVIQPEVMACLDSIGEWLSVNGTAVYNTRTTSCYRDGDTWFTADKDGKTLYAIYTGRANGCIEWTMNIPLEGSEVIVLETGEKLEWRLSGDKVQVFLPRKLVRKNGMPAFSFRIKT